MVILRARSFKASVRPPGASVHFILAGALFWLMSVLNGLHAAEADGVAVRAELGFTAEALLAIPEIRDVKTNASGDVAWVQREIGGWNVFVARAPDYQTHRLTRYDNDDGREAFLVGFGAEGEVIFRRGDWGMNVSHAPMPAPPALLSARESTDTPVALYLELPHAWSAAPITSEDGAQLYIAEGGAVSVMPIESGASPRQLFSVRGVIRSLILSPSGRRIAFTVDRSNLKRGKYGFVGVYDLDNNKVTYIEPGLAIDQDVVWSPEGDRLAFVRFGYEPRTWRFSDHREGVPFSIIVADVETGKGEAVFTADVGYGSRFNGFGASGYSGLGGVGNLQWLADDRLIFPYERTGWKLLYAVPADGGPAQLLTPGAFEIAGAVATHDRTAVYYWANRPGDLARLKLFRIKMENEYAPAPVALPEGVDMVSSFHRRAIFPLDNDRFFAVAVGARTPTQLIVRDPDGEYQKLSTGPAVGDPVSLKMPEPEVVSYKSLDGTPISAVLYRPLPSLRTGRNPLLVWVHGGSREQVYPAWNSSHVRHATWFYLLSQGYYVLIPNYRSGTGFGLDFREPKSYGGRGAGEVQDFIAAARFAKKELDGVDPDKFAIFGVSYGGHIATNALARSDAYAAGVSLAGVGDWVVEMEKDFKESLQFNIPQRMELEQMAFESSAISQIEDWGAEPILFVHGDNDPSAAMQQSLELHLALKRRGKWTEALIFPGEAHQLKKTAHILQTLETVEDFLDRAFTRDARR